MDLSNYSRFLDLFEKWNRSINLSAASTRAEISEHIEDSLHVVPHLRAVARVLDVGSGGGFPVVIAAIALPDVQFVSLEPVHKKHAFLRDRGSRARPRRTSTRAPSGSRITTSRDYDVAMSRATFDLADWLALGAKRVRVRVASCSGSRRQTRGDLGDGRARSRTRSTARPRAIVDQTLLTLAHRSGRGSSRVGGKRNDRSRPPQPEAVRGCSRPTPVSSSGRCERTMPASGLTISFDRFDREQAVVDRSERRGRNHEDRDSRRRFASALMSRVFGDRDPPAASAFDQTSGRLAPACRRERSRQSLANRDLGVRSSAATAGPRVARTDRRPQRVLVASRRPPRRAPVGPRPS